MATIDLGKVALTWKGTYSGATAYTPKDIVEYTTGGITSSYICTANSTGNVPTNTSYWSLMAKGQPQTFNDTVLRNDIATLAIRQATSENKGAYNTNSMYVDVFQDETGIATKTNTGRQIAEYVNTISLGASDWLNWSSTTTPSAYEYYQVGYGGNNNTWSAITPRVQEIDTKYWRDYTIANGNNTGSHFGSAVSAPTSNSGFTNEGCYVIIDFKEVKHFDGSWQIGKQNGYGDMAYMRFQYSNDGSTFTNFDFSSAQVNPAGSLGYFRTRTDVGSAGDGTATINPDYAGVLGFSQHSGQYFASGNDIRNVPIIEARYVKVIMLQQYSGTANTNAGFTFTPTVKSRTFNASGSFDSNIITAPSSVSSMGSIVSYQDFSGTNVLNTDVVLQLSADNGANWSTATLSALPNYSSTIKMAKVNDLAVTAGTQLKYKLNFANQSDGAKEARILGVSLMY